MTSPLRAVWVVPVLLGYPGYGVAGEVGVIAVDEETANVVAWTSFEEMQANSERLYNAQKDKIEAAFRRLTRGAKNKRPKR